MILFSLFFYLFVLPLHPKSEQIVRFNEDNMTKRKLQEQTKGLYQSDYEHDACGVGMVVNIHGNKSHELVDQALRVLENMEHRGAETRDKTGDGAGSRKREIRHRTGVST